MITTALQKEERWGMNLKLSSSNFSRSTMRNYSNIRSRKGYSKVKVQEPSSSHLSGSKKVKVL